MTPETRVTVLRVLGERHDALLEQLYQGRLNRYVKWHRRDHEYVPNPQRVDLARELRALRSAMRELKPRGWPAYYTEPTIAAWQQEGR